MYMVEVGMVVEEGTDVDILVFWGVFIGVFYEN